MAKNLYLIRKAGTFAPYESVETVTLTSNGIADYTGITGVASTNLITVLNYVPQNGDSFFFTAKTGGSTITTGATYYIGDASGSSFRAYTAVSGGTVVALGTNITAGTIRVLTDDLRIWSADYRDQFSQTGDGWSVYGTYTSPEPAITPIEYRTTRTKEDFAAQSGIVIVPGPLSVKTQGYTSGATGGNAVVDSSIVLATETASASISDEVAHSPLRQTLVKRTHWRFDIADFGPVYATWADGDMIATGPPNTPIAE